MVASEQLKRNTLQILPEVDAFCDRRFLFVLNIYNGSYLLFFSAVFHFLSYFQMFNKRFFFCSRFKTKMKVFKFEMYR